MGYLSCSYCHCDTVTSLIINNNDLGIGRTGLSFTLSPSNQTVTYGRIVEFLCQIQTCEESLFLQANGMTMVPYSNANSSRDVRLIPELDSREYGGNVSCIEEMNYTVRFWIVVNDETLKVVNYVNCKIGSHTVSDSAYITVLYPDRLRKSACTNEEPMPCMTLYQNSSNQESELIMTTTNKVTKPAMNISSVLLILCLQYVILL